MSLSGIPAPIRAVFFDAVGTLIDPHPPAEQVYVAAGERHGIRLDRATIQARFRAAFQAEELADVQEYHMRVSEAHERRRWGRIVQDVFGPDQDTSGLFAELWDYFARPDAWQLRTGAAETLAELNLRGFLLGLASNFDSRLNAVAAGLPEFGVLGPRIISSEVGWRKPAPEFFAAVTRAGGGDPAAIAFVGDRRDADYDGAAAAGMYAILVDPVPEERPGIRRIRHLGELLRP